MNRAERKAFRSQMWAFRRDPEGLTAERLLTEHRIAVAPGEGFGARGRGWARLSLAIPDEDVVEAAERLRRL